MSEPAEEKTARNHRVMDRYDELSSAGKHGHYETMFRIVREEVERERERCALIATREAAEAWQTYREMTGAGETEYTEAEAASEAADRIAASIRRGSV